jgi:hypothetical protein
MTGVLKLRRAERLQLLRFVCAAVWSDLQVSATEKSFILSLALRLGLPADEVEKVRGWLETPPLPEEVDPNLVPVEHRQIFLEAVQGAMEADHVVDAAEHETLKLLRELLG